MGCTCRFEEFPDYLRMDVAGNYSPGMEVEEAKEFYAQAFELCRKNNVRRLLAVFDMPGRIPTMSAYHIASAPDKVGMTPKSRVAVVHLDEERYKSNLFTEDVAVNRGWHVKVFNDENDAKLWLLDG